MIATSNKTTQLRSLRTAVPSSPRRSRQALWDRPRKDTSWATQIKRRRAQFAWQAQARTWWDGLTDARQRNAFDLYRKHHQGFCPPISVMFWYARRNMPEATQ